MDQSKLPVVCAPSLRIRVFTNISLCMCLSSRVSYRSLDGLSPCASGEGQARFSRVPATAAFLSPSESAGLGRAVL